MPGVLAALSALSAILTLIGEGAAAAAKINAVIQVARDEGRDVTNEEVVALQMETDQLEKTVRDRLASLKP